MPRRSLSPQVARHYIRRFDELQARFNPRNEDRFEFMLDMLEAGLPRRFRALELGAAAGSLGVRVLERFPKATYVALDHDPLLPALGNLTIPPRLARRLTRVDADLRSPDWTKALPPGKFDALLSTTTLHWLSPEQLGAAYRGAAKCLRSGGLLLNGDRALVSSDSPWIRRTALLAGDICWEREDRSARKDRTHPWTRLWIELRREPSMEALFAERERRFTKKARRSHYNHSVDLHLRLLRKTGFREAEVVWRYHANVVVAARR